jgi:hypothetical protein
MYFPIFCSYSSLSLAACLQPGKSKLLFSLRLVDIGWHGETHWSYWKNPCNLAIPGAHLLSSFTIDYTQSAKVFLRNSAM